MVIDKMGQAENGEEMGIYQLQTIFLMHYTGKNQGLVRNGHRPEKMDIMTMVEKIEAMQHLKAKHAAWECVHAAHHHNAPTK